MRTLLLKLTPSTLRYRLSLAFLLLIILPFTAFTVYGFGQIEQFTQRKIQAESHENLERMNQNLTDLMGSAYNTLILLKQDSTVTSFLEFPDQYPFLERTNKMQDKLNGLNNSFLMSSPLFITLVDQYGHAYSSYSPNGSLDYDEMVGQSWYTQAMQHPSEYNWELEKEDYISKMVLSNPRLISLVSALKNDKDNVLYAVAKVSIAYSEWFKTAIKNSPAGNEYILLTETGQTLISSHPEAPSEWIRLDKMNSNLDKGGYYLDRQTDSVVNYSYNAALKGYIVNRISTRVLFDELDKLKERFYLLILILTVAFIGVTLFISITITNPLRLLQKKMRFVTGDFLQAHIPEHHYRGEILELTKTFNNMTSQLEFAIAQLKAEERQKEAMRFQMLLSQMNPHFLLNTLNTVKWIARLNQDHEVFDICLKLGELLEAGLNLDVDLITLKEELKLIECYAFIQQYRFKDQFTVVYEIEPHLAYALVPKLTLQPLLENAIYHGIADLDEMGYIYVRIYRMKSDLVIEMEDNGVGPGNGSSKHERRKNSGIGLKNLRERLSLLYKQGADVQLIPLKQGTLVRITVPLLISTPFDGNDGQAQPES